MITSQMYFGTVNLAEVDPEHFNNAGILLFRTNKFLGLYDAWLLKRDSVLKPQTHNVNSGYRTEKHNIEIYAAINARRLAHKPLPLPPQPIATKSTHLYGQGIDLADPYDLMKEFILSDEGKKALEECDLYYEDFDYTDTWVHLQTKPFASYKKGGTRGYKPY